MTPIIENPTLLDNSTYIAALFQDERLRQGYEVKRELDWWKDNIIFDQESALDAGTLVYVDGETNNYRLIYKLRSEQEPRCLAPLANDLLEEISQRWRDHCGDSDRRLAVTSLFRTEEWQQSRRDNELNASYYSPHQSGMAIDFEPNGYYEGEKSVNRWSDNYDPSVNEALYIVLKELEEEGKCHVIWEKNYRTTQNGEIEEYENC